MLMSSTCLSKQPCSKKNDYQTRRENGLCGCVLHAHSESLAKYFSLKAELKYRGSGYNVEERT